MSFMTIETNKQVIPRVRDYSDIAPDKSSINRREWFE